MSSSTRRARWLATGLTLSSAALFSAVACSGNDPAGPGQGGSSGASTTSSGGAPNSNGGATGGASGGAAPLAGGTGPSTGGSGTGGAPSSGGTVAGGGSAGSASNGGTTTAGSGGNAGASAGTNMGGAGSGGMRASWGAAVVTSISEQALAAEYSAWKMAHAASCPDGSWVVKKDAGSVVSEGIAYGMLLAANFDDRALFDGLFKYYTAHADTNGLMNWATGVCDAAGNNNANAATDGDLDAAMALIQGHARWPGGGYLEQAKALAAKIIAFETEICDGRAVLRPGDKFGGCSDTANQKINPSYFAPGYYRVFAQHFPEQATRWNALLEGSYELFVVYQARMSGLVPDWSKFDGSDWYGSGYSYDACRTPWRVMIDYAWSGDPRAKTFLTNVNGWVEANGLPAVNQPNNSAFTGALALSGAYDKALMEKRYAAWMAANGDDKPYFQGTLRLLYLLAAAGKFPSTL